MGQGGDGRVASLAVRVAASDQQGVQRSILGTPLGGTVEQVPESADPEKEESRTNPVSG